MIHSRSSNPPLTRPPVSPRCATGFSLIELMLALTILSLTGIATTYLVTGTLNADRYLRACNTSQSEMDLTVLHLTNNIMESQSGVSQFVVTTTGTAPNQVSTLQILTQPDPTNSFPNGAAITYALKSDAVYPSLKNLVETDPRFTNGNVTNPNDFIILHSVTKFLITQPVSAAPDLYQVDIVTSGPLAQERHFQVYNRN